MTDTTNPRAALDEALAAMRDTGVSRAANAERITLAAVVACAEALALLVDAHLTDAGTEPDTDAGTEPVPLKSLPDDTPVGHGWVMVWGGSDLFRPHINGHFIWWLDDEVRWGYPGNWHESDLHNSRPATVGDLRRVGLPITEWPDIEAPEPETTPAMVYVDRDDLWVTGYRGTIDITDPGSTIVLDPGEAREIRDAITHWLDKREEIDNE